MRCSLFGKLSAKRDFIALSVSRDFLSVWEPWMQGCISASRDSLGDSWLQAYLTAPIWRFWLGADICGATVVGAFMSSLDGMGRYYPLTLFACATRATQLRRPISMRTINGSRLPKTSCSQRSITRLALKPSRTRLNNSRHRPTNQWIRRRRGYRSLRTA